MFNRISGTALLAMVLGSAGPAAGRTWTNRVGRTFEADFVRMDESNVIFSMSGRMFSMPLADLGTQDRRMLKITGKTGVAEIAPSTFGRAWPTEVRLDGPVQCKVISEDPKTGRYVYESPSYRFTSDAQITDDALSNFSMMFETVRKYVKSVPLSLCDAREGKLSILLFGTKSAYYSAGGKPDTAGIFIRGVVLVPMESLGLKPVGTSFRMDTLRRNSVLVHELVHQLTPEAYMQPGSCGWFSEGLAEYMAITPYNWGCFRPDIYGSVVKSYVSTRGSDGLQGRALGTKIIVPRLRDFLMMPYGHFAGPDANLHYGTGLLLTHYFFHMEGGGKAYRITQFLKGLQAGHRGEAALAPLLGGGSYEKLEGEITAAWAKMGIQIHFGD